MTVDHPRPITPGIVPWVTPEITPRKAPEFFLGAEVPRHWFDGDPFRTRLFDALSLVFPEGEKFFIACTRDYKDRVRDPVLAEQIRDFTYQESQHRIVHQQDRQRLLDQGLHIDAVTRHFEWLFALLRRRLPPSLTLSYTAAVEHFTAVFAYAVLQTPQRLDRADPRLRGLYAWHCAEEFEHRRVAFQLMQEVAGVGYGWRCASFLWITLMFPLHLALIMQRMFRADGYRDRRNLRLWRQGAVWLWGRDGFLRGLSALHWAYLRPGYDPSHLPLPAGYANWRHRYAASGDAIAAAMPEPQ